MLPPRTTKIVTMGLQPLPRPAQLDVPLGAQPQTAMFPPAGSIPESWTRDPAIARHRMKFGVITRGYSLFGLRKDKLVSEQAVGRDWSPQYPASVRFEDSPPWGDAKLAMLPAFAGLGDEVLDRSAIQALSSLPFAFANARVNDFSASARHAVSTLVNRDYNPVRFLWRLAAMFLGCALAEEAGGELEVSTIAGARDPRFISGTPELNVMLIEAAVAREQTVFVDAAHEDVRPTKQLEVLLAATAKSVVWRDRTGRPLPTVLGLWPEIPNCVLNVYGTQWAPVEPGSISSTVVWEATTMFVRQHGLQTLWDEIFAAVAVHALRPEGDGAWVGHKVAAIRLPRSELSPDGLGPLSQPMRSWIYATTPLHYPDLASVLWDATSRYAAISVAVNYVAAESGADILLLDKTPSRQHAVLEMLTQPFLHYVPLNYVAEKVMRDLGWESGMGRILLTMRGLDRYVSGRSRASKLLQHRMAPGVVQWEEVLPFAQAIPASAAIFPALYPVQPSMTYPVGVWSTASVVKGRIGTSDALYSVMEVPGNSAGYAKIHPHAAAAIYQDYTPMRNYRASYSDHQFLTQAVADEASYVPVFKSINSSTVVNTYLRGQRNQDVTWYYTEETSSTFIGSLIDFDDPDVDAEELASVMAQPVPAHPAGVSHEQDQAPEVVVEPAPHGGAHDPPPSPVGSTERLVLPPTSGVARPDQRITTLINRYRGMLKPNATPTDALAQLEAGFQWWHGLPAPGRQHYKAAGRVWRGPWLRCHQSSKLRACALNIGRRACS